MTVHTASSILGWRRKAIGREEAPAAAIPDFISYADRARMMQAQRDAILDRHLLRLAEIIESSVRDGDEDSLLKAAAVLRRGVSSPEQVVRRVLRRIETMRDQAMTMDDYRDLAESADLVNGLLCDMQKGPSMPPGGGSAQAVAA